MMIRLWYQVHVNDNGVMSSAGEPLHRRQRQSQGDGLEARDPAAPRDRPGTGVAARPAEARLRASPRGRGR